MGSLGSAGWERLSSAVADKKVENDVHGSASRCCAPAAPAPPSEAANVVYEEKLSELSPESAPRFGGLLVFIIASPFPRSEDRNGRELC